MDALTDETEGDIEALNADAGETQEHRFAPLAEETGKRLDIVLAAHLPFMSRSQLKRMVDDGHVLVNGQGAKGSQKIAGGDRLAVSVPAPRLSHIEPENIPLDIVYEDDDLLVVNKPKGLVVHPAPGASDGTLVNALLFHAQNGGGLSSVGGVLRPGIVHRLDRETTGLLVVAKNDHAHHALQAQIQARTATRRYQALVWGVPPWTEAVVDAPIQRHSTDRTRMAVGDGDGGRVPNRAAVTELFVRETFLSAFSFLECKLQTGRTHQIRVHCEFAGFPVVGDPVYQSGVKSAIDRFRNRPSANADVLLSRINRLHGQALHAFSLSFDQPTTGERLTFNAELPPEFVNLLHVLRGDEKRAASR